MEVAACKIEPQAKDGDKPGTLHPVSFKVPADVDRVFYSNSLGAKWSAAGRKANLPRAGKSLKVSVSADKKPMCRASAPEIDSQGYRRARQKPVSAVVGLAVTDDSVLEMVEKREQSTALAGNALS